MQRVQLEAAEVVRKVVHDGRNLTQVLGETSQRRSGFSAQERGALQDLSYGTVRFYSRLAFILERLQHRPVHDLPLKYLMLVSLYQLQYTRTGQHVIVDQAVAAARTINSAAGGLVNAILRNFLRQRSALLALADQKEESRYAYPKWWIDMLKTEYGAAAREILESGNGHPPMTLRVNVRRTTLQTYLALLAEHEIAAYQAGPEALTVERPLGVERLPNFRDGWVSVQDAGAQLAASLLNVQPGMRVLDACAAPGGKTAHLLESSEPELVALDSDETRLDRVRENLQRLRLHAELICGDAATPADWWNGQLFHRILADVPCSASGVVRRHPDIKWLRRAQDIESFAVQQARILESLWPLLARDGKLLYVTCSVFARENRQVVESFLARHEDGAQIAISAEGMTNGQLLPNDEHDGFFYALLHKKA